MADMRAAVLALYREGDRRRDELEAEDDALEALFMAADAYARTRGWDTVELYAEATGRSNGDG